MGALTREMEADSSWGADHKRAFMAWMDLLRQYHEALADEGVGSAMIAVGWSVLSADQNRAGGGVEHGPG